jgi:hypothetical protein
MQHDPARLDVQAKDFFPRGENPLLCREQISPLLSTLKGEMALLQDQLVHD